MTTTLSGLTVIDATTDFAGAICGRLLADAGAHVLRVTPLTRTMSGLVSFSDLGKDMRAATPEAIAAAMSTADVVLVSSVDESMRVPRATGKVRLVVSLPAFGSGPYKRYRAGEVILGALCGLADCSPGYPDWQEGELQPPVQSRARLAEFGAALTGTIAVLGVLFGQRRGRSAAHLIEVSQFEAAVALMVFDWGPAAYAGEALGRRRNGRLLEPNMFARCRDGYVVIVATNDHQWQALVDAMGSPAWASSDRFATILSRAEHKDELHAAIRAWALTNSGRDLAFRAQAAGVPCAFVLSLEEAVSSEQVTSLGSLERVDGTLRPADPVVVNGRRRAHRYAPRAPRNAFSVSPEEASGARPLEGVRIVDVSQLIAGPMVGQYLAALGAEVLIVESRRYPTPRMYGPFAGIPEYDASANFNHANRGKRSVELDLKTADGRRLFRELVTRADVVVENFSRRAAADLGLAYNELRSLKADIILASISAFGRSGPWGGYTANHAGVAALSGLAAVTPGPRGEPHLAGAIMPDVLTGAYMAVAVLEALIERSRTGAGAHVEVNMLDVVLNTMGDVLPEIDQCEGPACFLGSNEAGKFVAVERADCHDAVGRVTRGASARDAAALLQSRGIGAAPVQNMLEVVEDPHLRSRDFVQWIEHPVVGRRPLPGVPWIFDGRRPTLGAAPVLGSDTERVMHDLLGLTSTEIEELRTSGVLR